MNESRGRRHLVLVVGAGRSGTSLTAGVLGQLGYHVPQPEVQANFTNPRGFGEPRWVVDFHAQLMREQQIGLFDARPDAWRAAAFAATSSTVADRLRGWLSEQFATHERIVVKDPRTAWFIPLWRRCGEELGLDVHYVTTLRHPTEVLRSIRVTDRENQSEASRGAWWVATTLNVESATRGSQRAYLLYDDLLADWRREMERVERVAGLPLMSAAGDAALRATDEFVEPSLRRSGAGWDDIRVPEPLQRLADDVWNQVSDLARDDVGDRSTAALDELRGAYERLYRDAESIADSSVLHAVRVRPPDVPPARPRPAPRWIRALGRRLPPPALDRLRRVRRAAGGQPRR